MAQPQENTRWQVAIDLANSGRVEAAREIFVQLADEMPSEPGVWRWLANITEEGKQRVEFLERALNLQPDDSSTRAELHRALVRLGVNEAQHQRRSSARRSFERAIEVDPENEIALLWLIEVCDDTEQRVATLERLFELQPKDQSIRGALARDLALLGEKAAKDNEPGLARNLFRRANKLDPDNFLALLHLAEDEYEELGKRLEILEVILNREPDHARARALWDELARRATTESSTLPVNCCMLCRAPKEPVAMQCSHCGANLSLFDVGRVLRGEGVDRPRLEGEVARFEEVLRAYEDWRVRKSLLVARLNLGQIKEASRDAGRLLESMPLSEPKRLEIEQVHLYLLRLNEESTAEQVEAEVDAAEVVLVVDDSATVRTLVGSVLEGEGYEAVYASTGMEALAALRQQVPALVLLDIGLPNMDGYQLCQLIRQNPSTADVPVVMLSARDGFFDQVRGRMVGCQDYITKPFDSADLVSRVGSLVGRET